MRSNLVLCAIIALCSVHVAMGHTYFDSLVVNGQTHRECMRPSRAQFKEDPIPKVSDADMTCGFLPDANRPAQAKCSIESGSRVTLQWWHTQPGDDVVADTHKGPCMVYLAKSNTGSGPVWFKIFENGLDIATQTWCVDTLIRNRGKLEIQLPQNLTAGDYLIRGEVIAMHNGYAIDGAQPYVGCAELRITGTGQDAPPASSLVSFPGAYRNTDPGLWPVSLYEGRINKYTVPGPAVWGKYSSSPSSGNSGGGGGNTPSTSSSNNNGGSYTGSNNNNGGSIPTASSSATCGSVTVTSAMRQGASWGNPINNIFDITVVNRGSSDIRDLVVKITLDSNTPAYRITEQWNMVRTGDTFYLSEAIGAGKTYKGAGYIVAGGSASVSLVCASSSSGQQPGYEYASSSSSSSSAAASTSSSSSSSSSSTSSSSTTGTVVPPPPPPPPTQTSGNSGDTSCRAGISFTLSNSWNGGGMVSIVISNTGTKPIKSLKVRAEVDSNAWNLLATSEKRVYTVPTWTLPLAPGARFDGAGYTFSGTQPAAGSVVAEC